MPKKLTQRIEDPPRVVARCPRCRSELPDAARVCPHCPQHLCSACNVVRVPYADTICDGCADAADRRAVLRRAGACVAIGAAASLSVHAAGLLALPAVNAALTPDMRAQGTNYIYCAGQVGCTNAAHLHFYRRVNPALTNSIPGGSVGSRCNN